MVDRAKPGTADRKQPVDAGNPPVDAGNPPAGTATVPSPAWQRFRANRLARLGLAAAAGLYAVAALAPFLAGNRPLLFADGKGLEFPVLRAFTRADALWLAGFAGPLIAFLLLALLARIRPGLGRRLRSKRAAAVAALLLGAILIVLGLAWPDRLVHEDYRPYRDGAREASLCLFPPVPYAPSEVPLAGSLEPPSGAHWFGTDREGDDLLARLIHGARVSLVVGFAAVSVCLAIGVLLGALAGTFGGWTDAVVLRLIELTTCFPAFFAVLAVLAFLPPRIVWVMLLIGLVRWPGVARLTRGEFLRLRAMEFVTAARAAGLSQGWIMVRHMLPNALGPIIVSATFGMAGAILIESGLSFLGIAPADCQSWGRLLSEFRPWFEVAWWLSVFPGAAIFVTVTVFNLVGEGLRDALDPRLRGER